MNSVNTQVEELVKDKQGLYDISTTGLQSTQPGIADEIKFTVDDHINAEIKDAIDIHDDIRGTLDMVVCVVGDAPAVRNPYYYDQGNFFLYGTIIGFGPLIACPPDKIEFLGFP